ncbi:hypothetical protein SUDANB145_03701 [Streptomyces sp. enrichment culture]|uniref:hypothetical protein n=1 Tax=Streptomyces sp. ISL-12 TaxID=2819177 RepID=UPI001BE59514|nr:hypothetical protein [Streptomyces sp. ISL-12]MBT2413848.1 hypothetical protein [Streptomyces sp. ISL-12]
MYERRTPAPTPAAPQCATCERHQVAVERATERRDYSHATDERVLLARHQRDAHGGTW